MIATIKMLSNRILKIWNRCGNKRFYQFWHAFWMEIFHRLHDRVYTINRVTLAKDWSKMTDQAYCQAVADISQNISNGYQTSADSTVRVLSLSRFLRIFRKIVSHGCSLSGFCPDLKKKLSVVCLSDRKSTRQSCPDFHRPCPPTSDGYSKLDFLLDNFH